MQADAFLLWNAEGKLLHKFTLPAKKKDDARCTCMALTPDGRLLAGCSSESELAVWDVEGKTRWQRSGLKGSIEALTFCDNDTLLITFLNGQMSWRDASTGKELRATKVSVPPIPDRPRFFSDWPS